MGGLATPHQSMRAVDVNGQDVLSCLLTPRGSYKTLPTRSFTEQSFAPNQHAAILCRQWEEGRDTGDCLLPA